MEGEHPVVLGASLAGGEGPTLVALSRNFVPASVQKAQTGTLYTLDADGADTQTFHLLPRLPPGEQEAIYFSGQLEDANAGASGGGDVECVALFDEARGQWTLETVTFKLATKLQRGEAPGAHMLGGPPAQPEAAAAGPSGAAGAGGGPALQRLPSSAFHDELDSALFMEEEEDGGDDGAPAADPGQQHQQQHQQHQQQQEAASPEPRGEDDALWDDALPTLAAAQPAAAPPPGRRGLTVEVDDGDGGDGGAGQCSSDDSDGVGVEAL